MGEEAGGSAFALEEYLVPRHGTDTMAPMGSLPGNTMPKAAKDKGGLFAEVNRRAGDVPGPEKYHKDILDRSFVKDVTGGKFSSMGRDSGKNKDKGPSVGHYKVDAAIDKTKARSRGGQISKGDRTCFFAEDAERMKDAPAPGKYEPKKLEAHLNSPVFASPRTESRSPKKQSPMGPGYYNPQHGLLEKRVLSYSGSKDPAKSFLDRIMNKKDKDKTPSPGHLGIPESKWEDRQGKALHSARLLLDRHVSPRAIDNSHSPRM